VIVAAAVKTKDGRLWVAPRPGRHDDVYELINAFLGTSTDEINGAAESDPVLLRWRAFLEDREEGFTTESLEFLDRIRAMEHAKACKQTFACWGCHHDEHESGECRNFSIQHDRCQCSGRPIERGSGLTSEDLW